MNLVEKYLKIQISNILLEMFQEDDRNDGIENVTPLIAFQYLIYWYRITDDDLGNKIKSIIDDNNESSLNEVMNELLLLRNK